MSKLSICAMIICQSISLALADDATAQRKKLSEIDISYTLPQSTSLMELISRIEDEGVFTFVYSKNKIGKTKIILDRSYSNMMELLNELSVQARVNIKRVNETIVLKGVDETVPVPLVEDRISLQASVTGAITDETGEPLPGATVQEKGTTNGTITDADGRFTLQVGENATLTVSFVGYKNQDIVVNNRSVIDIQLTTDSEQLEEVVVVGYGTQSKRWVTGSISKVDMSKTETYNSTNVVQALRGGVAGVQVTDNGRPGQGGSILIRGPRSLAASNSPLIVMDGIIFNGSLENINPRDIQSIEVLKDASSTAIYGSRAANGVILITSKMGDSEKPKVSFNAIYGVSEIGYEVKTFDPERYIQSKVDFFAQSGVTVDPNDMASYMNASELQNYQNGNVSDPWEMATQSSGLNTYDLSISGRSNFFNYYISGAYALDKGLIFNDNQERISSKINLEAHISEWLDFGITTNFSNRDLSGREANLYNVYHASPFSTYFYDDGQPTQFLVEEDQVARNPLYFSLLQENKEITKQLFTNLYLKVKLPLGLNYRLNYSPNFQWNQDFNFTRQDQHRIDNITNASKFNRNNYSWFIENILSYDKTIGEDHAINITLLYGRQGVNDETTTSQANQLITDALGYNKLNLGSVLLANSSAYETKGVSSMFRINYTLKEKYLLTMTARRDGSSVFAENYKYATFPSGAIAWIVSEESFFKSLQAIKMLKLRVSYGSVGNRGISPYQSLSLSNFNQYVYGDGGTTSIGIYPSRMGNSNLKWETTYTANAAIDFILFDGKVTGALEFYDINTHDLIVQRSIPVLTGFDNIFTNIGQTNNRGVELSLSTINVQKNKFKWSSDFSLSSNRNRIVHLYDSDIDGDGKEDDDVSNGWFIGYPITSYYDYAFDGIYQEGDTDIPAGYEPGFVRLKDFNNDGRINSEDREVVGSGGQPNFRIGINNTVQYGNFTLSVFVNSMLGWVSPFHLLNTAVSPNAPGRGLNQLDAGYWTSENKSSTRPSLVYNNPLGHGWYMSRNFLRIQDVSISYNVSPQVLDKIKVSNLRVYLSGKNLYTFTKWLGSDPESAGTDPGDLYPMPRIVSLGVNIGL